MATPQNGEPSRIIGSISQLAGALVGTAVVTGKRIIGSVTPPSKGPSDKSGQKTMQAPAKRMKEAVHKTRTKTPKTKKKKVVKRRETGSSQKSKTSKKKSAPSPAKRKKAVAPGKKRHLAKQKRRQQSARYPAVSKTVGHPKSVPK